MVVCYYVHILFIAICANYLLPCVVVNSLSNSCDEVAFLSCYLLVVMWPVRHVVSPCFLLLSSAQCTKSKVYKYQKAITFLNFSYISRSRCLFCLVGSVQPLQNY